MMGNGREKKPTTHRLADYKCHQPGVLIKRGEERKRREEERGKMLVMMYYVQIVAWVAVVIVNKGAAAVAVPANFIFGDSLADAGNNNHLQYALAKANFPWYGIDFAGGVATGRFTNGRTIGDIITEKLGLANPKPYLSLSRNDTAVLQGVNYASGGGGILNETGFLFIERLSFDKQIEYFEATKGAIEEKIGARKAQKLCNEALYFIGMGSNDFINNYLLPVATDAQKYTPRSFINLLTSTLSQQLTRLHHLGARKIVYHGVGPLGCIPSQRYKSGSNESCVKELNSLIVDFNGSVQKLIQRLNSHLHGVKITYADTYGMVMKLVQNPQHYGFKDWKAPCCNVDTSFGQLCLPNSNLCSDREERVFWDAFHPTDAANAILAEDLLAHPDIMQYKPSASSPAPAPASAP